MSAESPVYWDPYDPKFAADPHPTYRRLREEAPLYYNEKHDFYAISRSADIDRSLPDWQTFSSSHGNILEIIKSGMELPPGTLIMEDPKAHTVRRRLLVRVFTPRRISALEPKIREFCARCLDPLVGEQRFDLISALGKEMPMRVISMLFGIPEADQATIRDAADSTLRTEVGGQMEIQEGLIPGIEELTEYVDWRAKNPSDDLTTELLTTEFEDENGEVRTLTREEVLTYATVVAGAGNETTGRLIGWFGSLLAQHPDQRAELAADPALIPGAIEEVLRYEPPGPFVARYVTKDVEYHGSTVPAGSAMLMIVGAANRDPERYPDPDRFDIHRPVGQQLTFGLGLHYCLGAALARLEGRVAMEELLKRFPEWDVDWSGARIAPTSSVRGWETLPLTIG
jgi:cytochrome P450